MDGWIVRKTHTRSCLRPQIWKSLMTEFATTTADVTLRTSWTTRGRKKVLESWAPAARRWITGGNYKFIAQTNYSYVGCHRQTTFKIWSSFFFIGIPYGGNEPLACLWQAVWGFLCRMPMADHIENSGLFSTGDVAALNNDLDHRGPTQSDVWPIVILK